MVPECSVTFQSWRGLVFRRGLKDVLVGLEAFQGLYLMGIVVGAQNGLQVCPELAVLS